ncbi:nucleotidyltransferase domain-containing protein [Leptolyngbya sp. PCC 6406]|uniref:nucleotidyltransferase domain-containing protein n=1 Tax=Leptolyngbya sp. PCC 6406 TaxID=1173264 RepID=UPI0002ACF8DC|nr:nucleotidyltransferase domain-containing protein [Leptolyngbya sp. PCC 6406]
MLPPHQPAILVAEEQAPSRQISSTVDAALADWLEPAIARLRQHLDPDRILLFGSWARSSATRRSDIDLFVVWDCDLPPLDRIGRVLTVLFDAPYPVDAIVYTPNELTRCQDRPFIRQLLAEGIVLYQRSQP